MKRKTLDAVEKYINCYTYRTTTWTTLNTGKNISPRPLGAAETRRLPGEVVEIVAENPVAHSEKHSLRWDINSEAAVLCAPKMRIVWACKWTRIEATAAVHAPASMRTSLVEVSSACLSNHINRHRGSWLMPLIENTESHPHVECDPTDPDDSNVSSFSTTT
jgi:hypothetical protein